MSSLDKNYDENNLGVECVMFAGLEFPIPFVSLLTRFFTNWKVSGGNSIGK